MYRDSETLGNDAEIFITFSEGEKEIFSAWNVCSVSFHLSDYMVIVLACPSAHVQLSSRTFPHIQVICFSEHFLPTLPEFPLQCNSTWQPPLINNNSNQVLKLLEKIHVGLAYMQFTMFTKILVDVFVLNFAAHGFKINPVTRSVEKVG